MRLRGNEAIEMFQDALKHFFLIYLTQSGKEKYVILID